MEYQQTEAPLFSINGEVFEKQMKRWIKEAMLELQKDPQAIANQVDQNGLMDTKQACQFLNLSYSALKKLMDDQIVVPIKAGKKNLFLPSALLKDLQVKRKLEAKEVEIKEKKISQAAELIKSYKAKHQHKKFEA
ncbi:hypothetical protein [Persicobacter psychrovividus]|uniref:Helix-turn-helix domain-containing protein n=1 Tax=Persicobacter psychrovividus TaxID=387638 RepID=A0ABM7VD36_9BACT|nr:hypothetical protein PEPS_11280 [Persicobacter psychrovividus]